MSAIVPEKLRIHHAKQFVESLTEASNDVYYLFIGRPTAWPAGDATVPTPVDSTANTTYEYWRDIMSFRRITANDVAHIVPLNQWTVNGVYAMYDHRTPLGTLANSAFYVMTPAPERAVFKCIHDGRTNATSGSAKSLTKPVVGGDVTALVSAAGDLNNYVWKYLYTISTTDAQKFVTPSWMPVRNPVEGESSDAYTIFNAARNTSNGSIQAIVVESAGTDYTGDVTAVITGDGSGAVAQPVLSGNKLSGVNVIAGGQNYTWATVTIQTSNTGSGATATAIISPRNAYSNADGTFYITNHGINLVEELLAKRVMLSVELDGANSSGDLMVGNNYRRVGIVRNPLLFGSNTVATANTYRQTLQLTVSSPRTPEFTVDEIVWQKTSTSEAYGVVVSIDNNVLSLTNVQGTFVTQESIQGIGNGSVNGHGVGSTQVVSATPEPFTPTVPASGALAVVSAISYPEIQPFSGDILYVDQRVPITRATNQTEVIRTILTF